MTKRSRHERAQRAAETDRVKQIEAAWAASVPAPLAQEFSLAVEAARSRGPRQRPADMAPGTAPNPPRPGREPKPPKTETRPRRGR